MKWQRITSLVVGSASIFAVGISYAAQDRYTLKSPNGITMSELRDYEQWRMIASSQSDDGAGCGTSPDPGCIKSILGNPIMVKSYANGIPANGNHVPDGAVLVKIEWAKARNTDAGYGMTLPGDLAEVAFMVKDSMRFLSTDGWGYAKFKYDTVSDTWTAFGDSPEFA